MNKCVGKVEMYSNREGFAGPKIVDVPFQAVFKDSAWTVAPADFETVTITGIDGGLAGLDLKLEVELASKAVGTSDKTTGELTLKAKFGFKVLLRTSTLSLKFDNTQDHSVTGHPADGGKVITKRGKRLNAATGSFALAGKGTLKSGYLNGVEVLVLLSGKFEPNPWAGVA